MTLVSQTSALMSALSQQSRTVLSDWRAALILRRASIDIPPEQRRWTSAPIDRFAVHQLLRRLVQSGALKEVPGLADLYQVTVAYAPSGALDTDELLMEVNPYASLSHLSALVYHSLTYQLPATITAIAPVKGSYDLFPAGTTPEDWLGLRKPTGRTPAQIVARPVHWLRLPPGNFFGVTEYHPRGYPLRITNLERTLIDGVNRPELSGGIANVLEAWAMARDRIDVDLLIGYVERYPKNILRQRVGFIIETLKLSHPLLEKWSESTQRGGSSKLSAHDPYAPTFSERWDLSINVPVEALEQSVSP